MTALPQDVDGRAPVRRATIHGAFPAPEKRGLVSALVSMVLHVGVIWLLILATAVAAVAPEESQLFSFLSPKLLPGGGGGGGNHGVVAQEEKTKPPEVKPPPEIPPPPPPPVEVPVVIPPVADPVPAQAAPATATAGVASAGDGGGTGGGKGTGDGPGTGTGKGPGSGSGEGGGYGEGGKKAVPPQSKHLVLPPDEYPKALKGVTLEVSFFVEVTGVVTEVKVNPAIKDKKFAKNFEDIMKGYKFDPGRDSTGKKIAAWSTVGVTFGGS